MIRPSIHFSGNPPSGTNKYLNNYWRKVDVFQIFHDLLTILMELFFFKNANDNSKINSLLDLNPNDF